MTQKKNISFILTLLLPLALCGQQRRYTVSGTIRDQQSGETLTGATITFEAHPGLGVSANAYGFYSISLPEGHYKMILTFSGYSPDSVDLDLKQDITLNKSLSYGERQLEQVVVTSSRRTNNILKTPIGLQKLNVEDLRDVPVLLGEKDVLKTIQLLPGVKSSGDGNSGFFVRGGSADQNLILLDEAPVYNASHLLGFFSVFNSDAIKDVSLYKGGMPASYGGRLASVEDIKMRDGNDQRFAGSGGIGLIATRLNFEGPIVPEKGSFMITTRRTYLDLFTHLASDTNIKKSTLYFYDINLKANYKFGNRDRVYLSGYFGKDAFDIHNGAGVDWGNATGTLRWNHIFSNKLFSNTSLIFSNYNYNTQYTDVNDNVRVASGITDYQFKEDLNYYLNPRNRFDIGFNLIYHNTQPGQAVAGASSKYNDTVLEKKHAMENAIYFSHEWTPDSKWKLTYGIRLTDLSVIGPGNLYTYGNTGNVLTKTFYSSGKIAKTYLNPEPRIAISYQMNELSSVKLAYDRNVQNIHLLNNSSSTSPTNVYLPTSNIVQPEIADQLSGGYYRNSKDRQYEFSTEVYYKTMQNQLDYKNNAILLGNNYVEADLLFGKGRAYGWENYIRKKTGKLTGWISYTLSRTERQINGINNNKWYPATQDQTHNLSIVAVYKYNRKWTFSADFVYNTGTATTWPSGKFPVDGVPVYLYSQRNGYRLPAYNRLDLSATLLLKKTARFQSDLNFSLYNAYGQWNPYTITFQRDPNNANKTQVEQTTLFRWIPSITYNFKF